MPRYWINPAKTMVTCYELPINRLLVTNIVSTPCKGSSNFTPNVIALGHGQGCSTNKHSFLLIGPWCGTIAYFVGGKEGRIWFNIVISNSTNLRELLGGICMSLNLS